MPPVEAAAVTTPETETPTTEAVETAPEGAEENLIPSANELRALVGLPAVEAAAGETSQVGETSASASASEPSTAVAAAGEEPEAGDRASGEEAAEAEKPDAAKDLEARTKAAEEALEKANAELETLKAEKAKKDETPAAVAPLPMRADFFGLDAEAMKEVSMAEKVRDWVLKNPEGGELPIGADGEMEMISPARAQAALAEAQGTLAAMRQAGRTNFSTAKRRAEDYVRQIYPNVLKPGHPDNQAFKNALAMIPGAENAPDIALWVGRMLRGYNAEAQEYEQQQKEKRQAAEKKPAEKQAVIPKAPAGGTVPTAPKPRTQPAGGQRDEQLAALRARAEKGDQAAMTEYFARTAA